MKPIKSLKAHFNRFSAKRPRALYATGYGTAGLGQLVLGLGLAGATTVPGLNIAAGLLLMATTGLCLHTDHRGNKRKTALTLDDNMNVIFGRLDKGLDNMTTYSMNESQESALLSSYFRSDEMRETLRCRPGLSDKKRARLERKIEKHKQYRRDVLASKNIKKS